MSYGVEALLKQRGEIDTELQKHKSPVTVMFTDLAGSTRYFERFGDTAGVEWLQRHNAIVVPLVAQHGGTVVKTIGDSVMAYFTDPTSSVEAAKDIQCKLHELNESETLESGMYVRVALHQGLGYLRGGDVFGDVVNVAARVTKVCLPGQILITESVYRTVPNISELVLNPLGTQYIRGKTSMETLYELGWTDDETYSKIREKFPPKAPIQQEELSEGRYQVLTELGRGAMGVVYKAYDRLIGRVVAMKTIPIEVTSEERENLIARLKQEARAAGILDHPNIITIFDFGEVSGLFYFTMQYVEGETFSSMLARKELLQLDLVLQAMDQICSAVGFAHTAEIIHRDLKPSNLMWTKAGAAKILDFGIAKLGDAGLTRAGMIVGTPSYLSPEQAAGRRLDARSDIFSLGAVFYELLTGERAFTGESTTGIIYKVIHEDPVPPRAIEPTLPVGLDAAVRKALAKDPDQRFQSCDEFREAIRNCRTASVSVPVTDRSHSKKERKLKSILPPADPSADNRVVWVVLGAVALAMASLIAIPLMRNKPPKPGLSSPPAVTATAPTTQPAAASPAAPETPSGNPEKLDVASSEPEAKGSEASATAPELQKKTKFRKQVEAEPESREASGDNPVFSVQSMLGKADSYAGRGEYDKAIYLYRQVLKLDSRNTLAREGLRRAQESQNVHR